MKVQPVVSVIVLHILVDDPRVHQGEDVEHGETSPIELVLRYEFLPFDHLCHQQQDRDAEYLIEQVLDTEKANALWKELTLVVCTPTYHQVLPEPEQEEHQGEVLVHEDARFELPQFILILNLIKADSGGLAALIRLLRAEATRLSRFPFHWHDIFEVLVIVEFLTR